MALVSVTLPVNLAPAVAAAAAVAAAVRGTTVVVGGAGLPAGADLPTGVWHGDDLDTVLATVDSTRDSAASTDLSFVSTVRVHQ